MCGRRETQPAATATVAKARLTRIANDFIVDVSNLPSMKVGR